MTRRLKNVNVFDYEDPPIEKMKGRLLLTEKEREEREEREMK